jgi:hypothetical protein
MGCTYNASSTNMGLVWLPNPSNVGLTCLLDPRWRQVQSNMSLANSNVSLTCLLNLRCLDLAPTKSRVTWV